MKHSHEKIHIPGLYFHKLASLPPCRPAFFRVSWPTALKPVLIPGYQLSGLHPPRRKSRLHNPRGATGTGLFQTEQFVAVNWCGVHKDSKHDILCKFKKIYIIASLKKLFIFMLCVKVVFIIHYWQLGLDCSKLNNLLLVRQQTYTVLVSLKRCI
jgi:hypothetical protein